MVVIKMKVLSKTINKIKNILQKCNKEKMKKSRKAFLLG